MKRFLSLMMILTLFMGCTVCSASNLQIAEDNYEDNICKEKVTDFDDSVLPLDEECNEEQEDDDFDDDFEGTSFKEERINKKGRFVRLIKKGKDSKIEFYWFTPIKGDE